jgi:hypothetical protein
VTDIISMLIDEVNALNSFYEVVSEANKVGLS